MKKWIIIVLIYFVVLSLPAQKEQKSIINHSQNEYQKIVKQILNDDDIFVLFYTNLALVVDPTCDTQIVEEVATDNPWISLKKYLYGKSNI